MDIIIQTDVRNSVYVHTKAQRSHRGRPTKEMEEKRTGKGKLHTA